MTLKLQRRIISIPCSHLRKICLPIIVNKIESAENIEINFLKSVDEQDFYDLIEIKLFEVSPPIENGFMIDSPEDPNKKEANRILFEFMTILSFCLGYDVSSDQPISTHKNLEYSYIPENRKEKKVIEEWPRSVLRQLAIGTWIVNSLTTNEDIIGYWDLLDPISMYINAENSASKVLKIREFLRIFEFFNHKYKEDDRFPIKGKEELSRDIIKHFADEDVSANEIERWWEIDNQCSHGGRDYITSLNSDGHEELKKVINRIRHYSRLLIEKIAQSENRT